MLRQAPADWDLLISEFPSPHYPFHICSASAQTLGDAEETMKIRGQKRPAGCLPTKAKRWSVPNTLLLLYPPVCSWTSSSDSFLVFTEYQSYSPSRLQFMQPRGSLCLNCEIIQTSEANGCSLQGHFAHIFLYEGAVKKRSVMFLFFYSPVI